MATNELLLAASSTPPAELPVDEIAAEADKLADEVESKANVEESEAA